MSAVSEDISKIRLYGYFPLGGIIVALSRISEDPVTRKAVSRIREVNTESGIVQLDAHLNQFDIMAAMCGMAKVVPDLQYAAGLMAAKWTKSGVGAELFKAINNKEHLKIQQVMRFEDEKHVSEEAFGQRKGTNRQEMDDYLNGIDRPHAVGNIAPYGSRYNFLKEDLIKNGAIESVRRFPSVCSIAKPGLSPMGFKLYLSPLIEPMGNISEEDIRRHIQNSFRELLERK
jgi:hypothetical protein